MQVMHLGGPYHLQLKNISTPLATSHVTVEQGTHTLYKLEKLATPKTDGSHQTHPLLTPDGLRRTIGRAPGPDGRDIITGWEWPIYVAYNAHRDPKHQHLIRGEQP